MGNNNGPAIIVLWLSLASLFAFTSYSNTFQVVISGNAMDPILGMVDSTATDALHRRTYSLPSNHLVDAAQPPPPGKPPVKQHFKRNKVVFMHPGKAGGGNIAMRMEKNWRLRIPQCHPRPCSQQAKWNNTADNGEHPFLFISLRDPVDRFVSAFYWRTLVLCHPEKSKRRTLAKGETCKADRENASKYKDELETLFYRYHENATALAVDLCSTNQTKAEIARSSVDTIYHAKYRFIDWLNFDWNPDRVYPLVLEPGGDKMEDQVDASMRWFFQQANFQKRRGFQRRAAFAVHQPQPDKTHSSQKTKQPIAAQAEQCLEKYHRQDYEMLKVIRDTTCKTEGCRHAISSILDRRKGAFQGSPPAVAAARGPPLEG